MRYWGSGSVNDFSVRTVHSENEHQLIDVYRVAQEGGEGRQDRETDEEERETAGCCRRHPHTAGRGITGSSSSSSTIAGTIRIFITVDTYSPPCCALRLLLRRIHTAEPGNFHPEPRMHLWVDKRTTIQYQRL